MRKKSIWYLIVALIIIAFIGTSCAQTAPETTTKPAGTTTAPPVTTTTTRSTAPQYGGVLKLTLTADITWGWDGVVTSFAVPGATYGITNDPLWWGDWAKGPAGGYGTNDTDWGGGR